VSEEVIKNTTVQLLRMFDTLLLPEYLNLGAGVHKSRASDRPGD